MKEKIVSGESSADLRDSENTQNIPYEVPH